MMSFMFILSIAFMLIIIVENMNRIFRADEMTDVSDDENTTRVYGFFMFLLSILTTVTLVLAMVKI